MSDNQKRVIIKATRAGSTASAWYLDCEGDKKWFPKSLVTFDEEKEELEAPVWLLKEKFPDETF